MRPEPWLSIIGFPEVGESGLGDDSRAALHRARVVFGAPRHLERLSVPAERIPWATPFDLRPVLARRGEPVAVLASGDPFWYGVGGALCEQLAPGEWRAYPAPSSFSLAAAALGWRLERVTCLGLHAQPLTAVRPWLQRGQRLICLVRDAAALHELAELVTQLGYGEASAWALQALGGQQQRIEPFVPAQHGALPALQSPLALALWLREGPAGLPRAAGLPDAWFEHDGQLTKSPVRALTLRALAPRPGERLWDLGAGCGSISIEWCLAGGRSLACERDAERAAMITRNAERFGVATQLHVHVHDVLDATDWPDAPDAVFVGGGWSRALWARLAARLPDGVRVVVNGVTLQTQQDLWSCYAAYGGELLQLSVATAEPLGRRFHAWTPARPIVQWTVGWRRAWAGRLPWQGGCDDTG